MASEKGDYAPLLEQESNFEEEVITITTPQPTQVRTWAGPALFITVLLLGNIILGSLLWHRRGLLDASVTGVHKAPRQWRTMEWASRYAVQDDGHNTKAVEDAWDRLRPAHGVVAVDTQWAADNGLQPSMELPSDTSKRVYILEAYHLLHCLKIIRQTLYQAKRGQKTGHKMDEADHCFDVLRQNVICHADDTLIYTLDRGVAGNGQQRSCRNWDALRDWATEHTACSHDITGQKAGISYQCDDGDDGLIW